MSRPLQLAIEDGLLTDARTALDYGCGRGGDLRRLRELGFECAGWDLVHAPDGPRHEADVVNLGYVVNVIEHLEERADALRAAWSLARGVLVVSARLADERSRLVGACEHADGVRTGINTFQKFYRQSELRSWIAQTLEANPVAAAPGVFYVFRDPREASALLAGRYRAAVAPRRRLDRVDPAQAHPELVALVSDTMLQLGREPFPDETEKAQDISDAFGSWRAAVRAATINLSSDAWSQARRTARDDLLVYLALAKFEGRCAFNELALRVRRDVKVHFASYANAVSCADRTLLQLGDHAAIETAFTEACCGKLLPAAFYVHMDAIAKMPVTLRLYEGCARALTGTISGANLVKLSRRERKVSYLSYPDFERDPHPRLHSSTRADLQTFDVRARDFTGLSNPPVLHRKEAFVASDHPRRSTFERLTAAEERAGLLSETSRIGTLLGWQAALADKALTLRGHRLVSRDSPGGKRT